MRRDGSGGRRRKRKRGRKRRRRTAGLEEMDGDGLSQNALPLLEG